MEHPKHAQTQPQSGYYASSARAFVKGRNYRVYVTYSRPHARFIWVDRQMVRLPSNTPLVYDAPATQPAPPLQLNWDALSHADLQAARVALNVADLHTLTQSQLQQLQTQFPSWVTALQTTPTDPTDCKQECVLFAKAMNKVAVTDTQACAEAAQVARDIKQFPNASAAFAFKAIAMLKKRADLSEQTVPQLLPILFIKSAVDDMSASGVDVSACDIKLVIERAVQQARAYSLTDSIYDHVLQQVCSKGRLTYLRNTIYDTLVTHATVDGKSSVHALLTTPALSMMLRLYDTQVFFNALETMGLTELALSPTFRPPDALAALDPPQMYFSVNWLERLFSNKPLENGAFIVYGYAVADPFRALMFLFEHKLVYVIYLRLCTHYGLSPIARDRLRLGLLEANPSIARCIGDTTLLLRMLTRNFFHHLSFEHLPARDEETPPFILTRAAANMHDLLTAALYLPQEVRLLPEDWIAVYGWPRGLEVGVVKSTKPCVQWRAVPLTEGHSARTDTLCGIERYVRLSRESARNLLGDRLFVALLQQEGQT